MTYKLNLNLSPGLFYHLISITYRSNFTHSVVFQISRGNGDNLKIVFNFSQLCLVLLDYNSSKVLRDCNSSKVLLDYNSSKVLLDCNSLRFSLTIIPQRFSLTVIP